MKKRKEHTYRIIGGRHRGGPRALLAVAFAAIMLLTLALSGLAAPPGPSQIGNPLPNNCSDITEPGEAPPVCCAFGYVYHAGLPVAGAQVVIQSRSGVFTTTTSTGASSPAPYYAKALSDAPLNVTPGETITLTASYNGAPASTVYQVVAGGQQVDVVIPTGEGDQPPIGTINYIHPNPAGQRSDVVAFAGSGADGDADETDVVAWEWASDLDGVLSEQEDFQQPAYTLSVGTHTIALRVQDNEGNWSSPVVRDLTVEPMAFDLLVGWQVVALPALPTADYDAQQLLEDVADQGGCPAGVARWLPELSNWGSYLPEPPIGNFSVESWRPYFLRADCESPLRLPAGASHTPPPEAISLTAGWNFVVPPPTAGTLTAEVACQQIAAQGGAVSDVARWSPDVGDWAGHVCDQPFGDFELTPDTGYFINSQTDSVWRPGSEE